MVEATREGLDKLVPIRRGYLEAQVGAGSDVDPFARGELGMRITDDVAALGWGQVDRRGWTAGAGARWVW